MLVTPKGLSLLLQGGQSSRSNGSANGSRGERASGHAGTETPKVLVTPGLLVATKACHMYLLPTLPKSLVHTEKPFTKMEQCTHTHETRNRTRTESRLLTPLKVPFLPGAQALSLSRLYIQTMCSTARPHRQGL